MLLQGLSVIDIEVILEVDAFGAPWIGDFATNVLAIRVRLAGGVRTRGRIGRIDVFSFGPARGRYDGVPSETNAWLAPSSALLFVGRDTRTHTAFAWGTFLEES